MLDGFTLSFKPLDIITEGELEAIESGFLSVLEKTGMRFEHKIVLKILEKGGCKVDYDSRVARFPKALVLECLRLCPSRFNVKARESKNDLIIGGNRIYYSSDPGNQRLDLETGESRDATREEFYQAVVIYDALEHLHAFHPNSPNTLFSDILPEMASVETYAGRTRNSSKSSPYSTGMEDADIFSIQIAQAVGAQPLCPMPGQPPLACSAETCAGALRGLEAGFPMMLSDGDVFGATAPVTNAGALVHGIAEIAAKIVFVQLYRPGTGVMPIAFTSPQNMRNGAPFFGNIGVALHDAAFNQIWRRYDIPRANLEPGISNSKCLDFQNGYERAILTLISALSGCNYIFLFGTVYGELASHPLQAILDDDIAGMIGRFVEGFQVNDETLAIDLINQVGLGPRLYGTEGHTRKWWRNEQFIPRSADLATPPEWLREGHKTCVDHVRPALTMPQREWKRYWTHISRRL
jgi:trimethylamine--corrinoid protein Co-methyltransferase